MTREEAIIRLKVLSVEFSEYKPLEEAFDMAIKALEQTQPRKGIGLGQRAHVGQERIKEICKVAHIDDISDLSDGYHTFRQLYYHRMILFAVLVKQNRYKAWKSLRHENGELCFGGGWFIVGIDTPEGSYTYHYENRYFDLFDCEILDYAKHWDGHTEKDVIRLLSLEQESVFDKIRAEIKKAIWEDVIVSLDGTDETRIPRLDPSDVFEILDKYTVKK